MMRFPTRALIKPLVLDVLGDGRAHTTDESQDIISRQLRLDEVQLTVKLPNGHRAFQNEHAFALNELKKDGHIDHAGKRNGSQVYEITSSGRQLKRTGPTLAGEEHRSLWRDVDLEEVTRAEAEVRRTRHRTVAANRGSRRTTATQESGRGSDIKDRAEATSKVERPSRLTITPDEHVSLEGYEFYRPEALVKAEQRELQLVARFKKFLAQRGRQHLQERLIVGGGSITYDLFDGSHRILFEAKADASARDQIRMAVGQLFDYGYHGFERLGRSIHKALLLPAAPAEDVSELLGYLEIGVAYERERGVFEEDYPWA